jgi:hypothetical protein
MRLSQCSVALASFLPNTRIAIGIVLASPDKNNVQPSTFRFPRLNLPASSRPAPNPIAPRVAAISAISGTVILLGSKVSSLSGSALCKPKLEQSFLPGAFRFDSRLLFAFSFDLDLSRLLFSSL